MVFLNGAPVDVFVRVIQTVVTCLDTLQKDSDDPRGVSSVVVGTENREILILDPSGTSILKKIRFVRLVCA